jgi:hypothetical protein
MGCLGTDADPEYVRFLPGRLAESIENAAQNLTPARAGWAVIDDFEHTHCRRWIFRPDKMRADPFGAITVRANMHPGYENPDAIAPSGPVDPGISLLSIQSEQGKPLALLVNYANHYFGSPFVSSDYYGLFAANIAQRIGSGSGPFVAMMSQGTSGDQMCAVFPMQNGLPGPRRWWLRRLAPSRAISQRSMRASRSICTRIPCAS